MDIHNQKAQHKLMENPGSINATAQEMGIDPYDEAVLREWERRMIEYRADIAKTSQNAPE